MSIVLINMVDRLSRYCFLSGNSPRFLIRFGFLRFPGFPTLFIAIVSPCPATSAASLKLVSFSEGLSVDSVAGLSEGLAGWLNLHYVGNRNPLRRPSWVSILRDRPKFDRRVFSPETGTRGCQGLRRWPSHLETGSNLFFVFSLRGVFFPFFFEVENLVF